MAPGSYFYKVTAEDAAGNIGPVSNTASGHRARHDTADGLDHGSGVGGDGLGHDDFTANASDNGLVAGVQFKLDARPWRRRYGRALLRFLGHDRELERSAQPLRCRA